MKPIDKLTNGQHSRDIKASICTSCGSEAKVFRNEISRREHRITGFCQRCQDDMFGED